MVLRQHVKDESAKASLSGPREAFMKAKKWPALVVVLQQLSARGVLRHMRGKLLKLIDWVEEGDV